MSDYVAGSSTTEISSVHRRLLVKTAAERAVTPKALMEQAIELKAGQHDEDRVSTETVIDTTSESRSGYVAEADQSGHAAQTHAAARSHHAQHAQTGRIESDVSERHRRMATAAAAAAGVSLTEWYQQIILEQAASTESGAHAQEQTRTSAETRTRTASEHRTEASHAGEPRDEAGRFTRREVHREEVRTDGDISAYHSRIAARAAAEEAVPLSIWIEQAIQARARPGDKDRGDARLMERDERERLERERLEREHLERERREREPRPYLGRVQPEPAPAPQASTVVSRTELRGRGGELLGAVLLGAVLATLLILTLSWLRWGWGSSAFAANFPANPSYTVITANPAVPGPPAPPPTLPPAPTPTPTPAVAPVAPNVTVTTLVNGVPPAPAERVVIRRPGAHPHHWRRHLRYVRPGDGDCDCYVSANE